MARDCAPDDPWQSTDADALAVAACCRRPVHPVSYVALPTLPIYIHWSTAGATPFLGFDLHAGRNSFLPVLSSFPYDRDHRPRPGDLAAPSALFGIVDIPFQVRGWHFPQFRARRPQGNLVRRDKFTFPML